MRGHNLTTIFNIMRDAGLVRSKRDFATHWLGRGKTYLRDYEYRAGRDTARVSPGTVKRLQRLLTEIAARSSLPVKQDLLALVARIEMDCRVADLLDRR